MVQTGGEQPHGVGLIKAPAATAVVSLMGAFHYRRTPSAVHLAIQSSVALDSDRYNLPASSVNFDRSQRARPESSPGDVARYTHPRC